MSAFEFILILVSVVAGFAVSEILSGWGRVIREHTPISKIGVHLIASSWLLLMIVRYVWLLWDYREIDWRFVDFVLAFAPILVLALAAYVTNPARIQRFDPVTHYLNQARPFCYLVALFLLLFVFGAPRISVEPGFTLAFLGPLAVAAMLMGLAHVRRPVVHGVAFGFMLLMVTYASTVVVTNLGPT